MAPGFFRRPLRGNVSHQTHQPEFIFAGPGNGHFFLQPITAAMPAGTKLLFVAGTALAQGLLRPAIHPFPIRHLNLMPDLHFFRRATFAKKPLGKLGGMKGHLPIPSVEHDLRLPENAIRMLDQ